MNRDIERFDFFIFEDEYKRVIFRFLPNDSHCHSFDENPPKSWREVYKVYYSFSIICFDLNEETGLTEYAEDMFSIYRDECSVLTHLAKYIRGTLTTKNTSKILAMGQPGSEWEISWDTDSCRRPIKFEVWDNWSDNGFRFRLSADRAEVFACYLDFINDYMLKHGECI